MERRNFISKGCGLCAGLVAMPAVMTFLQGCSPLEVIQPLYEGLTLIVEKSSLTANMVHIIRHKKIDADILLVKRNEKYIALRMMCTHEEQPLTATNDGLYCSSHGSRFDLDGNVIVNPATKNLEQWTVIEDNQVIKIFIKDKL